jgi:hypothetical protein
LNQKHLLGEHVFHKPCLANQVLQFPHLSISWTPAHIISSMVWISWPPTHVMIVFQSVGSVLTFLSQSPSHPLNFLRTSTHPTSSHISTCSHIASACKHLEQRG